MTLKEFNTLVNKLTKERDELEAKCYKLKKFLHKKVFNDITENHFGELCNQFCVMVEYLALLNWRIREVKLMKPDLLANKWKNKKFKLAEYLDEEDEEFDE